MHSGQKKITFPKISKNQIMVILLIFCISTNCINFLAPFDSNQDSYHQNKISKLTISQEINYLIDIGFGYNYAAITAQNMINKLTIQNILDAANNNPKKTLLVIRDNNGEDIGFNWKKARYFLEEYDLYYLFDEENTDLENMAYAWHAHDGGYSVSTSKNMEIHVNSLVNRIIWVMDDESNFYNEVNNKFNLNEISLNKGMDIFYSDLEEDLDIQIGKFIFQKGDKTKID